MTPDQDTRDRVIRLEAEFRAFADSTGPKVDEMHAILLKSKGAKWGFYTAAGLFGALGAKLSQYVPFGGN